jgi:hypothetical protein
VQPSAFGGIDDVHYVERWHAAIPQPETFQTRVKDRYLHSDFFCKRECSVHGYFRCACDRLLADPGLAGAPLGHVVIGQVR